MIRTFDDLFTKMQTDELPTNVIKGRLEQLNEAEKNWKQALEQLDFDAAGRFRHEIRKQANYVIGYLSCMEDLRYLTPEEGSVLFHIANETK